MKLSYNERRRLNLIYSPTLVINGKLDMSEINDADQFAKLMCKELIGHKECDGIWSFVVLMSFSFMINSFLSVVTIWNLMKIIIIDILEIN